MPPKRRVRATASPSPARGSRASTPRGGALRTPIPAKYSTSYGSSMTQLPDRSHVGGGGDIAKAAAEIFTKVKQDKVAAQARRQINDQARLARQARDGSRQATESPLRVLQPTVEEEEPEEQSAVSEEGSEYEYQRDPQGSPRLRPKPAKKRPRDDEEAEARAEQERRERASRLRQEQSAEARRKADQKRAEAEAANAERERLRQQALQDEAAKAAMPPPQLPAPRAPGITMTPTSASVSSDLSSPRPASARSFIEERNLFLDAELQTPKPRPRSVTVRQPVPPPPPVSPPRRHSPPSVLKRAPRRPGKSPGPRVELSPPPEDRPTLSQQLGMGDKGSFSSIDDAPPQYTSRAGSGPAQSPLETLPNPVAEQPPASISHSTRKIWSLKDLFSLQSIFKAILSAFLLLHLIRLGHTLVRPDLFESPVLRLNWYGWEDWTSNVGQFFPSPLLHPLGVLTNNQYDDLKDFIQRRMTTTDAAVENLKMLLPRVVVVRKDKSGKIMVAEEFWNALQDRINHDEKILKLDGKSRISEKHWKALQERLKNAGLLDKPLSTDDVEKVVERSAPASWERWLQKNHKKVAEIVGQTQGKAQPSKPSPKGTGTEAVVSREEFIKELTSHLAKHKKEIDSEMAGIRKDILGLIQDVKFIASTSAKGLSKNEIAEIAELVKQIVSKQIGDKQLIVGYKGGVRQIDAALRRRINHFSPGNNALPELSSSSPTWEIPKLTIGSKKWLKTMGKLPRFHQDINHALTGWTDPGHCWCAGLGKNGTYGNSAVVVVQLANAVIPQYVVLEHIDPLATTDPLAMPKDVEVWALFDGYERRDRVLNWMSVNYPNDMRHKLVVERGFAKIGAFTYKHVPKDEGVFVHRLSDQLLHIMAATDMVLIRAVTNYGEKDHTCFYRIRMYGDVVDVDAERERESW